MKKGKSKNLRIKKLIIMKRLAATLMGFLFLLPCVTFGQNDNSNFSINLSGGTNYFHGDINSQWGYLGKGGLKYNISNQFALEGEFRYGLLKGGDDQYDRKFENQFMQYGINGVLNVSKLSSLHVVWPNIAILAKAGIHQMNSSAQDLKDYPEGTEPRDDYNGSDIVFPLGGKIKYNISKRLDIGVGVDYTYTNTDQIDNYDVSEPTNRFNDGYSTYTLGLTIKLGDKSAEHADWDQSSELEKKIEELDQKYQQKLRVTTEQIRRLKEEKANKEALNILNDELNRVKSDQSESQARDRKEETTTEEGREKEEGKDRGNEGNATKSQAKSGTTSDGDGFHLDNRRFVTVLGSFKTLDQAKQFADQVAEQGYNPGVLYNYYRDWFYVHVNKHEDNQKAIEARKKVAEDLNINDAWVYFRSADDLEKYKR